MSRATRVRLVQRKVACAALSGIGYGEIEENVIACSGCSGAEEEALRLYAWSFFSRFEQRRLAVERLLDACREVEEGCAPADVVFEGVGRGMGGSRETIAGSRAAGA